MNLEDDLRRTLRRESPAPGFAIRVLERIELGEASRSSGTAWRSRHTWRNVAASLTLTVFLGSWGALAVHERRQAEGERAREQVLVAMRIAGEKVRYVQHEVRDIGSPVQNDQ